MDSRFFQNLAGKYFINSLHVAMQQGKTALMRGRHWSDLQ